MGGRGTRGGIRRIPTSEADIEAAIRAAHATIVRNRPDHNDITDHLVRLADIHAQLDPRIDRAAVDRVLDKMIEQPDVQLTAELNQRLLTPADRAAEVVIGDEARHVLLITPPDPSTPQPAPISGALSDAPLADNGWGRDPSMPVAYHDDGPIGTAIKAMGEQARIDVDGQPLANVLGVLATDVVAGRRTAQQALDEFKTIRDRLPAASHARRLLDGAIGDLDAPGTPPPAVPDGTPEPLRDLAADLHRVPLVRRDPGPEQDALRAILDEYAAGRLGPRRLIDQVRQLANRRHESLGEAGKLEIDRAVHHAVTALSGMDRSKLRPPELPPELMRQVKADIRDATQRLAARDRTDWVGLADLRHELGTRHQRATIDAALRSLVRGGPAEGMDIEEETNQKTLTQRDRAAAINIGARDQHVIRVRPESPSHTEPDQATARQTTRAAARQTETERIRTMPDTALQQAFAEATTPAQRMNLAAEMARRGM